MQLKILEIIARINSRKKRANMHPDFVTRKEIVKELIAELDITLENMVDTGILHQGNNINDIYFIKK